MVVAEAPQDVVVEPPRLGVAVAPTREQIDAILAGWLGRPVRSGEIRQLRGGLICTILEVTYAGGAAPVVLRLSGEVGDAYLARQAEASLYTRQHTSFPMPEVYRCDISGELAPFSYTLMERIPGRHLGEVREGLSEERLGAILTDLADACAAMHGHEVARYGQIGSEESWCCWVERTAGDLARWHDKLADKLSDGGRASLRQVIDELPAHLEGCGPPCLVHGDIWNPNIMIHEERMVSILDHEGLFWPAEKDLADLEIWGTVDARFFDRYREHCPDDGGYERRRRVHWLGALLLHVDLFAGDYVPWAEDLMHQMCS